jgi:hypothetical protein
MIYFVLLLLLVGSSSMFNTVFAEYFELPSLQSYGYDSKYKKISRSSHQPVGILVVAYNRPQYFRQLIASLEKNPESQSLPFYFVLEGGPQATQKENVAIIRGSSIKHKKIILRKRNYGLVKNFIDAERFMFDWCGFKKIIIFEEDVVVSPSYLKLTLNLHKWATSTYANVGAVSCWSYCFNNRDIKKTKLDWVQASSPWWNFVTYCLDKKVWNNIKNVLYTYETRFINTIPHSAAYAKARSKPSEWIGAPRIRSWIMSIASQRRNAQNNNKKIFSASTLQWNLEQNFCSRQHFNLGNINQDSMMAFCLWMAGYIKIETVVNRAKHIGDYGVNITPTVSQNLGINKVKLDTFSEDQKLTSFQKNK